MNTITIKNTDINPHTVRDRLLPGRMLAWRPGDTFSIPKSVYSRHFGLFSGWGTRVVPGAPEPVTPTEPTLAEMTVAELLGLAVELGLEIKPRTKKDLIIEAIEKKQAENAAAAEEAEFVERTAEACHEANRAYCLSIGDDSQPAWADAPEWQKDSARDGVRFVLAHPDVNGEKSHERWMERKIEEGWVYGETKDSEAKTHPCLVPYADLPEEHRVKDAIFLQTIFECLHGIPTATTADVTAEADADDVAIMNTDGHPIDDQVETETEPE